MKQKLAVFCFIHFFIVGLCLMAFNKQWIESKNISLSQLPYLYYILPVSFIVSPILFGVIADKWVNREKLFSFLSFASAISLLILTQCNTAGSYLVILFLACFFVVPNLALLLAIVFNSFKTAGVNVTDNFPGIRFWGSLGFYFSVATSASFAESNLHVYSIYLAVIFSVLVGIYVLFLPRNILVPKAEAEQNDNIPVRIASVFSVEKKRILTFLIFSVFAGILLVLAESFSFELMQQQYKDLPFKTDKNKSIYIGAVIAISEISKIFFIFTIPFFIHRFGYKKVLQLAYIGWIVYTVSFFLINMYDVKWILILSSFFFGLAINFHYITSLLVLDIEGNPRYKTTIQATFIACTFGAGSLIKQLIVDFAIPVYFTNEDKRVDWSSLWLCFTALAVCLSIAFALLFRKPKDGNIL